MPDAGPWTLMNAQQDFNEQRLLDPGAPPRPPAVPAAVRGNFREGMEA
jgi:hypothetical protein